MLSTYSFNQFSPTFSNHVYSIQSNSYKRLRRESDNGSTAIIADLRARLLQAEEELDNYRTYVDKVTQDLACCRSDLKRETYLKKLAVQFIPEDQLDEYMLAWPCAQMHSSSPVSFSKLYLQINKHVVELLGKRTVIHRWCREKALVTLA